MLSSLPSMCVPWCTVRTMASSRNFASHAGTRGEFSITSLADSIVPMSLRILLVMVKVGEYMDFLYNTRMVGKTQQKKRLHVAVLKQMVTLVTGGVGLVAAPAWDNVIQEFVESYIKPYLPQGSGVLSLLLYALLVTALAVTTAIYLSQLIE